MFWAVAGEFVPIVVGIEAGVVVLGVGCGMFGREGNGD
jgi:hypothetical protein